MDALVNAIVNHLWIPLQRQLQYLAKIGSNMAKLTRYMDELKVCEAEVQEIIRVAAASSSAEVKPIPRVSLWMEKVQNMKAEVLEIDNGYNTRKTCTNCWSSWRISKRAAKTAIRVREFTTQKQNFPSSLIMVPAALGGRRIRTLQDPTVLSTESHMSKIFEYLRNGAEMLGIWGMGGVGKTTLLRRIYDHPFVDEAGYDHVIWAVASQELSLDRLRTDIAKTVGLNLDTGTSQESPAELLYHFLLRKRFLLLLDDIWEPFDLRELGISMAQAVFTTRSDAVCNQMMASQSYQMSTRTIKLECLQQEEAWELFLHNIGLSMRSTISSDERVCHRAHQVANKCGGLPLVLVVIAHTMSASNTWQEWEDTINSLDKIGVPGMWSRETDPFPILKVSYDRLPNDNIKKCFLCCALWPKDHNIWKTDLINCWLGMNLISDCHDISAAYSRGYTIIECLKRASLLEEVKDTYETTLNVHDVIRGMAHWIMSDSNSSDRRWTVLNRAETTGRSEDLELRWRESEAISSVYGWLGTLPQQPCCPNLLALMLQRNHILSVIPDRFFQNMIALRYLDLSNTGIVEIPLAISTLLQLQFLNVSCTSIKSLPMELASLGKLIYFVASYLTHLTHIPQGLISSLDKLELLDLRNTAYDGWEMSGEASMAELKSPIQALGIDIRRLETVGHKGMSPWWLIMKDFNGVSTFPLTTLLLQIGNSRDTLRELEIWFCPDLVEIVFGSNERKHEFLNLELLRLLGLQNLMRITWSGAPFRNIRVLSIRACASLHDITWILNLCYLESLDIQECAKMLVVIAEEGDQIIFSHLKRLQLAQLPELCSFSASLVAFPCLIYISIDWCPKLDESPFSDLKIRRIYQDEHDGARFSSPPREDIDDCHDESFTEGR